LSEDELVEDDVEFEFDDSLELPILPVFDVRGDLYVCGACGSPLTEIPAYNRFYCQNCGLHY
jgi:hypothetical protein